VHLYNLPLQFAFLCSGNTIKDMGFWLCKSSQKEKKKSLRKTVFDSAPVPNFICLVIEERELVIFRPSLSNDTKP